MKPEIVYPNPSIDFIGHDGSIYVAGITGVNNRFIRIVLRSGGSYSLERNKFGGYNMTVASSSSLFKACKSKDCAKVLNYLIKNGAYIAFYPIVTKLIE